MLLRYLRCALLIVLACHLGRALAYEEDVHYGLTKWLALKAGFKEAEAETLALGDQTVDGQALDAVRLVAFNACLGRDQVGSELVREHHFPTTGQIPGPPPSRSVVPGSQVARLIVTDRINNPIGSSPSDNTYNLRQFGVGLHRLQDSYSHQGEPDIPMFTVVGCSSDYAWGHPKSRNGWQSHDADLTYEFPRDADAMAKDTFAALCSYADYVLHRKCPSWFTLDRPIADFNRRSTRQAKWDWFESTMPGRFDCEFISRLDLNDGTGWICKARPKSRQTKQASFGGEKARPPDEILKASDPTQFVAALLNTWFVQRDFDAVATHFADLRSYRPPVDKSGGDSEVRKVALTKAFAAALAYERSTSVNHRRLNEQKVAAGFALMQQFGADGKHVVTGIRVTDDDLLLPTYSTIEEALFSVGPDKQVFDVKIVPCLPGIEGPCAMAAAAPRAHPQDNLLLELRKIRGGWQLVGDHLLTIH